MSRNLFRINNVSSTQGFQKYYYAPTYFLETTSIFVTHWWIQIPLTIPSKKKIPTPFCSLLSIAGTLKLAYLLASFGPTKYFGLYHIQVLGCISISWKFFCHPCFISHVLKYVLIASSTRTDFKHRYDENNLIIVNSWTCCCNKSSLMDKTFLSVSIYSPITIC